MSQAIIIDRMLTLLVSNLRRSDVMTASPEPRQAGESLVSGLEDRKVSTGVTLLRIIALFTLRSKGSPGPQYQVCGLASKNPKKQTKADTKYKSRYRKILHVDEDDGC